MAHNIFSVLYLYLQFCHTTESFEMVSEKVFQVVCVYQQRIYPETIYQILQQCFIWMTQDPSSTWSVQQLCLSFYSVDQSLWRYIVWRYIAQRMIYACVCSDLSHLDNAPSCVTISRVTITAIYNRTNNVGNFIIGMSLLNSHFETNNCDLATDAI